MSLARTQKKSAKYGPTGCWRRNRKRLQTDADRARVIEGLTNEAAQGQGAGELGDRLKQLGPRWFIVRNAHEKNGPALLQPRWAMSFMRGPMTRLEIRRARSPSIS